MTREELQTRAIEMSKAYDYLLLEWATRVGKTPAAIRIISHSGSFNKWNIVVAETSHIKQWKEEFHKFGFEFLLPDIQIFCYASLHKHKENDRNWVFDECHHIFSKIRWEIISELNISKALFLSATVGVDESMKLGSRFKGLRKDSVSLTQAIKWKILPQPKVFVISKELDDKRQDQVYTISKGLKKDRIYKKCVYKDRFRLLARYTSVSLQVICTELEKYLLLSNSITKKREYYEEATGGKEWAKNAYLREGGIRKKFLADIKTGMAQKIITLLSTDKKRFICFSGSIDQCENLGGHNVIHSGRSLKENNIILTAFNDKGINSIYAVGMLKEGINLYHVDAGIIIQLDNSTRTYIQRSGRIFLGEEPIQYILYIKDTQDEVYLEKSLEDFSEEFIYKTNINEL